MKFIKKIFWGSVLLFNALSVFVVIVYKYFPVKCTPLMVIREHEYKTAGLQVKKNFHWVSLNKTSKNFQLAAMAAEDDKFIEHSGFDFEAILKAYRHNQNPGHVKRGGSTISQQTAKNVFLWPGRSWLRKGLECYFTLLTEGVWGKRRIMEVYLNVVETGTGIYGMEAASQVYFRKTAADVSKIEAAAIIATLPNPRKFSVLYPSYFISLYRWAIVKRVNIMEKVIRSGKRNGYYN